MSNSLKDVLSSGKHFAISYELVPARSSRGSSIDAILKFAEQAKLSGLFDALSLTDNPGGEPALAPDILGKEIMDIGIDPIIHFSAKDENRNSLESRALALDRAGLENLLVITGDYPATGQMGLAKPVFDLDSVHLLYYLKQMNEGLPVEGPPGKKSLLDPTNFFLGCVVSPFKSTEPEVMTQYYKLEKKVKNGADYIITQLGYDTNKYHELLLYMRSRDITIPVLGSVFVLRRGVARMMNRGDIPGCKVTDEFLIQLEDEYRSTDKGEKASLERASRQIAILKGMGYHGAHIEGFGLQFDDVQTIIERSKELEGNWEDYTGKLRFSPKGTYYLYDKDKYDKDCKSAESSSHRPLFRFSVMWEFHRIFFHEGSIGYRLMRKLSAWLEVHSKIMWAFYELERRSKAFLFDCRDCGDCVLPEMQFMCPESKCPKFQRIGPCGGSDGGKCEVFNDRYCVWYPIYMRAKCTGTLEHLRCYLVPPRNWALYGTSSWINFFLQKDHTKNSYLKK